MAEQTVLEPPVVEPRSETEPSAESVPCRMPCSRESCLEGRCMEPDGHSGPHTCNTCGNMW